METAAEKYRRQKKEQQMLHDVQCTCGFTFKCRRASKQFWVASGMMPTHMIELMVRLAKAAQNGTTKEIEETLEPAEAANLSVFSNHVVLYTAVDPEIVETPSEPNQIAQKELDDCCYLTIRDWQMKGGDEAAGLATFPNK